MAMLGPVVFLNNEFIRVNIFGIFKYTLYGLDFQFFKFFIPFKECRFFFQMLSSTLSKLLLMKMMMYLKRNSNEVFLRYFSSLQTT